MAVAWKDKTSDAGYEDCAQAAVLRLRPPPSVTSAPTQEKMTPAGLRHLEVENMLPGEGSWWAVTSHTAHT